MCMNPEAPGSLSPSPLFLVPRPPRWHKHQQRRPNAADGSTVAHLRRRHRLVVLLSITQRAFDTLRVGPPGPPMVGFLLLCSGPPGCSTLTTRTGPASLSWPAPALSPLSTRTPGPASSGPCMLLLAARGPTARARSKPNGRSCPAATHARVPGSQRACPRALSTRWVHWLCT
jgi:hypothetical protein